MAVRLDRVEQGGSASHYPDCTSCDHSILLFNDEHHDIPPPPPPSPRTLVGDSPPMLFPSHLRSASLPSSASMSEHHSSLDKLRNMYTAGRTKSNAIDCGDQSTDLISFHTRQPMSDLLPRNIRNYDHMTSPANGQPQEARIILTHQDQLCNCIQRLDLHTPENASLCSNRIDPSSPHPSWTFSQASTATNSPNSSVGRSTGKRMRDGLPAPKRSSHPIPFPPATACDNSNISWPMPIVTYATPRINSPKPKSPHASRSSWYSTSRKPIISPPIPLRPPPPSRSTSQERSRPSLAPIHRRAPKPPTKKASGKSLASMKHQPLHKKSLQFFDNLPSFMDFDSDGEHGHGLVRLWCGAWREKKLEAGTSGVGAERRRARKRKDKAGCMKNTAEDERIASEVGEDPKGMRAGSRLSTLDADPPSATTLAPQNEGHAVRKSNANEKPKKARWRKLSCGF